MSSSAIRHLNARSSQGTPLPDTSVTEQKSEMLGQLRAWIKHTTRATKLLFHVTTAPKGPLTRWMPATAAMVRFFNDNLNLTERTGGATSGIAIITMNIPFLVYSMKDSTYREFVSVTFLL